MKRTRKKMNTNSPPIMRTPITRAMINKGLLSSKTLEDMPAEVIQEILSMLPITSLSDSRYVCKKWRDLIKEPRLSLLHYNQTCRKKYPTTSLILCNAGQHHESQLYYVPDFTKCKQAVVLNNLSWCKSWIPFFNVIGSCNGFMCLADDSGRYRNIFICNPASGDCVLVPENPSVFGPVRGTNFGFGYDQKKNEYKVVRLRYIVDKRCYEVEIHTLGTNSWRNIGKVKRIINYPSQSSGVLVNGSLHWLGTVNETRKASIVIVDLADEKVHDILPVPIGNIVGKIAHSHHLGELGGNLIIVDESEQGFVDVWMMAEYGKWGSWTKQYIFERPSPLACFRPLVLQENGEILVEVDCGALFIYNTKWRKHYRKVQIRGLPNSFKAVPHMGTLVTLKNAMETPIT